MNSKAFSGWAGKILNVDLSSRTTTIIPTSHYEPETYIGGVGLCTKIFWDMDCPDVGAFDPESPLMISVGPLTGLPGQFNRAEIAGIAPQSHPGEYFAYSGFGGVFPSRMKYAGYDAIVILGRADTPVYLSIRDDRVEIADATDLWGLDLIETQRVIKERNPDMSVLTIGPAGENLSRIAVVGTDTGSTAGQGGFGAVMGSKNLKAVCISGSGKVSIARPGDFESLIAYAKSKGEFSTGAFQRFGRGPILEGDFAKRMVSKYRKKTTGPYGCPFQCMGFYDVPGIGKGAGMCASWWYGFFSQDERVAFKALHDAQRLGINHFDLLGLVFTVFETIGNDIVSPEEWMAAGFPLPVNFKGELSEYEFVDRLLQGIAQGSEPFADGALRALLKISETVSAKEDFRRIIDVRFPAWGYFNHYYGWLGLCLHMALDSREAGDSTDGYLSFNREGEHPIPLKDLENHFKVPCGIKTYADPETGMAETAYDGIEHQTIWVQHNQSLKNSLPMCNFASLPDLLFHPPEMDIRIFQSRAFSAVTGVEKDPDALWKSGEQIWHLRRAVMVKRENRSRKTDTLAEGFFDTEWMDAQHGDFYYTAWIYKDRFESLKERFYKARGMDSETGFQTREKLESLSMGEVADELERLGKLAPGHENIPEKKGSSS